MATALVSNTSECCICFETFKTPKILPCGHTFCLCCMERLIGDKTETFPCPTCKRDVKIPKGGAKDFTTNFQLTPKHTTQVRDQPPSTTQPKCPNHNQREVDYYCKNCNVGLCSKCIFKQHRDHETLDIECDETRNEAIKKLKSSKFFIQNRIKNLEKHRSTLLQSFEQLKSVCEDSCAKVTEKTEKIVSDLRTNCEQIKKNIKENLEENRSKEENREMEITSEINVLESNMESIISPSTETTINILQTLPRLIEIEKLDESREDYDLCIQYLQWVGKDFSLDLDELGSVISKPFYIPDIQRKHVQKTSLHGKIQAVRDAKVKIQDTIPAMGTLQHLHYMVTNSEQKPPAYWKKSKPLTSKLKGYISGEKIFLEPISSSSSLYTCIENLVQKTWRADRCGCGKDAVNLKHSHIRVTSIERVENEILYYKYCARRRELFSKALANKTPCTNISRIPNSSGQILTTKLAGKELTEEMFPEVNEHYGFHGCHVNLRVETICRHGLDHRCSGDMNLFGPAVYMSESFTKADQYADEKQNRTPGPKKMIMVRMLLGNTYLCTSKCPPKYKRPPCTDLQHLEPKCEKGHDFFDSVMADGSWLFREFAVYDNSSVYPEYIITYNRI